MAAMVRHRLIVRDFARDKILLVRDQSRQSTLPSFEFDEQHPAEVSFVNRVARERWGIECIVLRSIEHVIDPPLRTYEMELLELPLGPPTDDSKQWVDPGEVKERELVTRCIDEKRAAEWEHPGWWSKACSWIAAQLSTDLGKIEFIQRHGWQSSSVIQSQIGGNDYFFKAVPPHLERECAVTAFLSDRSDCVPRVIAVDRKKRWMLLRGFHGSPVEDCDDLQVWILALESYAALQVASLEYISELESLGCARLDLTVLKDDIESLLADEHAMMVDESSGVPRNQLEFIRRQIPELRRGCDELTKFPVTIEHGDLWPSNILVGGGASVVIDWEDVRIAPPFFGIAPLLAGMEFNQPKMDLKTALAALRQAYARAFATIADPGETRRQFDIAVPIAMFAIAIGYKRQPTSMVAVHPWMREMVPYFASFAQRNLLA